MARNGLRACGDAGVFTQNFAIEPPPYPWYIESGLAPPAGQHMPSRLVVVPIILFWLVSASWLCMREIIPLFRAGQPPAFFTDVVAEVRGSSITWRIMHKGKDAGSGFSQVKPLPSDRSFELYS